jgi:hypothetical protein
LLQPKILQKDIKNRLDTGPPLPLCPSVAFKIPEPVIALLAGGIDLSVWMLRK